MGYSLSQKLHDFGTNSSFGPSWVLEAEYLDCMVVPVRAPGGVSISQWDQWDQMEKLKIQGSKQGTKSWPNHKEIHPRKTNMELNEPNNWWFVDVFPFPRVYFQVSMLVFWGVH